MHPRRGRIQAELKRFLPSFLLLLGFMAIGLAIGNLAQAGPEGKDSLFAENLRSDAQLDIILGNGVLLAFAVSSTFAVMLAASYIFRANRIVALAIIVSGSAFCAAFLLPGQPLLRLLPSGGESTVAIGVSGGLTPLALGGVFVWGLSLLMLALIRDRNPWATVVYIILWIAALVLFLTLFLLFARQ